MDDFFHGQPEECPRLPEAPQMTTLPGAMTAPGSVGEKHVSQTKVREGEPSR